MHEHVVCKSTIFLVGRTLEATEGKPGSLRQTAEEVFRLQLLQLSFHTRSIPENSGLNFNVEVTQQGCKEGLLRKDLFRSPYM